MNTFQGDLPDLTRVSRVPADGPEIYIETYGCQMNVYDSQAITGLLEESGFHICENELAADVILLNTCSVRDLAEHKIISRVGELRHRRQKADLPQPVIGICGCMAERLGKELRKGPRRVDLVVGVDSYDTLPDVLRGLTANLDRPFKESERTQVGHRSDAHYVAPPNLYPTNNSPLVTIHKGCDYKCTYCIVPYTRGPQSEKAPDTIVEEIRGIVAAGGDEVTLLGQNVTAYRWDDDLDFAGLLELVAQVDGLERIRFLTGHPKDMQHHLMDTIARLDKVCPWLHIPVQSGSDRVLRRMKRLYSSGEYLDMVDYARKVIPDVTFSADIIVGFPGETETDFQDTLEVIRRVKYDQLFSFKYSERPGVPAARLEDDVTLDEKKRRLADLIKVQDDIWKEEAAMQIGREWTAIAESEARRPAGSWRLRTANNRKVVLHDVSLEIGEQVRVRITDWANTTFVGELLT